MRTLTDGLLRRDIKTFGAALLVLNGFIGSGIFILPGLLNNQAGDLSPWLFLCVGLLMISVIITFAALARHFHHTGGPVLYVSTAFGEFAGFQVGWLLYLGRLAAVAANANVFMLYCAYIWPEASEMATRLAILILLFLILITTNVIGVKRAIRTLGLLTVIKMVPIFALIFFGMPYVFGSGITPSEVPELADVEGTILLLMFAFLGFEGALVVAGETRKPTEALPEALIKATLFVTVIYFLVQMVFVSVYPDGTDSQAPLVDLGAFLLGPYGATIVICTAIFSVFGNVLGTVVAAPRMTLAMADEGSIPPWFAKVNERYGTPANSIIFFGVLAFILAVTGSFVWLAIASTLARMIAFLVCFAAIPRLKRLSREQEDLDDTYVTGGYITISLATALCLWAALSSDLDAWFLLAGFAVFGAGIYWLTRRIYGDKEPNPIDEVEM